MMDREGGVFIDGYYAVANSYEPALVYDEELPEQIFKNILGFIKAVPIFVLENRLKFCRVLSA